MLNNLSEFQKRAVTVVVLLPVVLSSLLLRNSYVFFAMLYIALIFLMFVLATKEWSKLLSPSRLVQQLYLVFMFCVYMFFGYYCLGSMFLSRGQNFVGELSEELYLISVVVWFFITLYLIGFNACVASNKKCVKFSNKLNKVIIFLGGPLCLAPIFPGFLLLDERIIFLMLLLVWATDTGGYIFGKKMGKHLLAANISPKKTLEGVLGGIVLAEITFFVYMYFSTDLMLIQKFSNPILSACFVLIVSLSAVVGDLFESAMKRIAGVKDSGNLLPGHGGILDRIDAILCALPVFVVLLNYM